MKNVPNSFEYHLRSRATYAEGKLLYEEMQTIYERLKEINHLLVELNAKDPEAMRAACADIPSQKI